MNGFPKKGDLVTNRLTDLLTDKVIHRGAPLLKKWNTWDPAI